MGNMLMSSRKCPAPLLMRDSVLSLKERIKLAEKGSSRRITEKFREAVLCRPMTQSTTMPKDDCAAEDCSAILVEIADELGDPPFGQLITFSVLALTSSHSGSLGGTTLLRRTYRRLADCSFPHLLIHFLQGFAY
uniref:Uncharacterized protein n=1 Tax=Solanum tuberosum TaxID=4113 RepID=M1DQ03_SOLTU